MANWKHTLDVSSFYHNDSLSIVEKAKMMSSAIKMTFPKKWLNENSESYDEELDSIQNGFSEIFLEDTEEFDDWMESLYDWCDQEVAPFGKWPKNKMCWVKTK